MQSKRSQRCVRKNTSTVLIIVHRRNTMPQGKAKLKVITVRHEEMMTVVISDTLAMTMIELFSVMKRRSEGLFARDIVETLYEYNVYPCRADYQPEGECRPHQTLESKLAVHEHEADKVEQYSRRPNLRFTGIPETTNENCTTENNQGQVWQRKYP